VWLRSGGLLCSIGAGVDFRFWHGTHLSKQEDTEELAVGAPNAMLMMFLDMVNFLDLNGIAPVTRRRQLANRIAHKFFLPTQVGNELVPPMFDFHQIVSDASLRKLETILENETAE
jgi:hypothetical protein